MGSTRRRRSQRGTKNLLKIKIAKKPRSNTTQIIRRNFLDLKDFGTSDPSDKGGKRSYCESDNKYKKSHNLTETKGNFNEFFSEDFGKKENELDDSFFGKSLTDLVIPGDIPDINLFMVSENELSLEDFEKESTSPRRIPCERKKDNESDDLIFSKSLADLVIPGDVPNDLLMACNIEFVSNYFNDIPVF